MTALPDNSPHMDISQPHLPHDPTRSQLLEQYWYDFLKFQQTEIKKRLKSGFGVPKVDFSEGAFWEWLTTYKLQDGQ